MDQAAPVENHGSGRQRTRGVDKTRVLVVEDESDIAGLVKHTLERSGDAIVEVASSGDQALKAASEQPPDLIILDLNLPVLGGLEVCRLLRTRPSTAKTPIIMLTARTTESDRVVGLDAGADDYITKPFSPRALDAKPIRQLHFAHDFAVALFTHLPAGLGRGDRIAAGGNIFLGERGKSLTNQPLTLIDRTPRRVRKAMRFGPFRGSPSTWK